MESNPAGFMDLPEAFLPLILFPTKDTIKIRNHRKSYLIDKSLAAALSPHFLEAIKSNPMINEIFLPIDDDIEAFFSGKSIKSDTFLTMSILLNNKKLIKQWKEENEINQSNAIDYLMIFIKNNAKIEDTNEILNLIGENFEQFENQIKFDKIPSYYLSELFKKVKKIESEKDINKYVLQRIQWEKEDKYRKELIKSIDMRGLNNDNLKELIEKTKFEDLSEQILSILKNYTLSFERDIFFMKYKKDTNYKKDPKEFSPLHYAAKENYQEIGAILISKGANINAKDIIYQIIIILFLIKII